MLIRLLFFSLIFLTTAYSKSSCFDGDNHNISHWTKNDMGKSSYHCAFSSVFLKILLNNNEVNKRDAVLDFGAGYGCVTYELASLGFKNIIASDIEAKNLQCLQQHQNQHLFIHKPNIKVLKGDILNDGQYESMKNGSLGLVYARNVIHLMEGNDIIKLLKISHQKLKHKGIIVLEYENDKRNQLAEIIHKMSEEIKEGLHTDNVKNLELKTVKKYYKDSGCSFDDYLNVSSEYRAPGFPCQYHTFLKANKKPVIYQYIDQKRLMELLVKLKFKVLFVKTLNDSGGSGYVFAQKET